MFKIIQLLLNDYFWDLWFTSLADILVIQRQTILNKREPVCFSEHSSEFGCWVFLKIQKDLNKGFILLMKWFYPYFQNMQVFSPHSVLTTSKAESSCSFPQRWRPCKGTAFLRVVQNQNVMPLLPQQWEHCLSTGARHKPQNVHRTETRDSAAPLNTQSWETCVLLGSLTTFWDHTEINSNVGLGCIIYMQNIVTASNTSM